MNSNRRRTTSPFLLAAAVLATAGTAMAAGAYRGKLTAAYATLRGHGARVNVGRTVRDFGSVKAGRVLTARFDVANTGGKRLLLVRLASASECDCLSGDGYHHIPPGGQKSISLKLDTRRLAGPLHLRRSYRTNDRRRPVLHLEILAAVRADVDAEGSCLEPVAMP